MRKQVQLLVSGLLFAIGAGSALFLFEEPTSFSHPELTYLFVTASLIYISAGLWFLVTFIRLMISK